ncbi:archaeal heat shock protein Hsp20 [Thermoproteota archaeon]
MSYWDDWFSRFGRSSIFGDLDRFIEEIEKELTDSIKMMDIPDNMLREREYPDGSIRKEYGPFVYGYSMRIGPDGKPTIREFGNMKPQFVDGKITPINLHEKREPLVDIIEEDDSVKVFVELPGVKKEDIHLHATPKEMTISVDTDQKKFFKELKFASDVDENSAHSVYLNGVLEIVFKKLEPKEKGTDLKIE